MSRSFFTSLIVGSVLALEVRGDLPGPDLLSEAQPPTREQWFALYYLRQARQSYPFPNHRCEKRPAVGPLELAEEVNYYLCNQDGSECSPPPRSCSGGCYGIRHPMPYYIPNPTLAVERPARVGCRSRHENLRQPESHIQITIGVWE